MMQNTFREWAQFLDRPAISIDTKAIETATKGRRVLITGAGGSIGSALAMQCGQLPIEHLIVLDSSEKGIFDLDDGLRGVSRTCVVGDICDEPLLNEIFSDHRPQIVFHAAACKHVPLMEQNPFTAARTNAIGTCSVAKTASRHGSEQLILLSTDKAVDAASIMGATKRMAELIVLANGSDTRTKAVRLGNVLGTSGSVVPQFLKQMEGGCALTVTHPEAARYFLALDEAVSLLLSALLHEERAAVLISEAGTARHIAELARFLIEREGSASGIEFTELRSGDKLREEMISARELVVETFEGPLRKVSSPALSGEKINAIIEQTSASIVKRDLKGLLRAVSAAVPEYQPGPKLLSQLKIAAGECR
ncbi:polysaccharide biosynthesis protein [Acidobacterium sp. S8]|uniref:polysaccharide biosynthesis protein n=1 Tax=Acidobacterium sp. S8 TaxID=1641854 RepID=UPI00131E156B|nr:polysaccharide biosynthesis protein [Acidobacterium sp. S8]